jgi:hypothetical protein
MDAAREHAQIERQDAEHQEGEENPKHDAHALPMLPSRA